ncbi:MAG: ABC transporter [Nitrospira sp.]|nr:ABC transporter [Nitrospira sp.]
MSSWPTRAMPSARNSPQPRKRRSFMNEYRQEIAALTMRWVRRLSREKFSMLFTLIQPMLFWLIFFGNLFQRAADVQVVQAPNYISFLTAGVVVMTVLNNGLAGGVDLLFDKENGFLERLMSTPIHRTSVILSRFLFVTTVTSLQVLVILGVAFLFGVTPATGFFGVAVILLIGMLFGVGLTAISMAMAFSVKSHGDFFSVLGFLSLPMIFLSSALVPLSAMPKFMAMLAVLNPMTWAIDAIRPLILTGWADALRPLAIVVLIMLAFDALCLYGSAKAFRRAIG